MILLKKRLIISGAYMLLKLLAKGYIVFQLILRGINNMVR